MTFDPRHEGREVLSRSGREVLCPGGGKCCPGGEGDVVSRGRCCVQGGREVLCPGGGGVVQGGREMVDLWCCTPPPIEQNE